MVKCNIDIDACSSESDIEEVVITFRPTPRKTELISSKEFYEKHRFIQEHIAKIDLSQKQIPGRHRYWPSKDPSIVGLSPGMTIKNRTQNQLKIPETTNRANGFPTTVISFDSDEFVDAEPSTYKKDKTITKIKADPKLKQFSADSFELLTNKYKISVKQCKDKRERKKQRFHSKAPIKKQAIFSSKAQKMRKLGNTSGAINPDGQKMTSINDPYLQANINLSSIKHKEKTLQGYQVPDYLPDYFKLPKEDKTEEVSNKNDTRKIVEKEEKSPHAFAAKQTQTLFKTGIERKKHKASTNVHDRKEYTSMNYGIKHKVHSIICKIHKKNRALTDKVYIKKKGDSINYEKDERKSKSPEEKETKNEIVSIKRSFGEKKRDHSTDKETKKEQTSFKCEIGEKKVDLPCDAEVKKETISNKSDIDIKKKVSRDEQIKKEQILNECEIDANKSNLPDDSQTKNDETLITRSNGESPLDEKSEFNKLIISENDNKIDISEANSAYTHLTQQMEAVVDRVEILSSEVKTTNVRLSAILTELQGHHGIVSSVAEISIDHGMESEWDMSSLSSAVFEEVWQEVYTPDVTADKDNKETISRHANLEKVLNFVLTETPTAENLDDKLVEKNLSREKTINFATIKDLTNSEQPISTTNNLFTSKDSDKGGDYNSLTEAAIKLTAIQTSNVVEPECCDATEPELSHNINKLSLSKKPLNEKKIQLDDQLLSSDSDSNAIKVIKSPPVPTQLQNMSTKKKTNINQILEIKNTTPSSSTLHESSYVESDMLDPPKVVHLKKLGANDANRRAFIFTVEDMNTNRYGNKPFLELEKLTTDTESYEEKYLDKPKKLPAIQKLNTSQPIKPSVSHHPTKVYAEQRKAKAENIKTIDKSQQKGAEKERTGSSKSRLEHLITSMVFTVRDYVKFLQGANRKPKQDKPVPQTSPATSDYVINSKKRDNSRVPHNSLASSLSGSNRHKKMKQHKSTESVNLSMSSDECLTNKKKETKKHRVYRSSSCTRHIASKAKKADDQISSFTFSSTTSSHVNDNVHNVPTCIATTQTSASEIVPKVDNLVLATNEKTTNPCQKKNVNFVEEKTDAPVPCTCIIQERLVYPASSSGLEVEIPSHKSNKEAENLRKYFDHADELQLTSDTSTAESVESEEAGHCNRDVQTTFSHIYSNLKETCLYCTSGYLPVYDEGIIRVIYNYIKEYDSKDIGIIVNVANSNLFHIKIIVMSSGRSISCFYSTIQGLQEAKRSGIMDHFPVYFV